MRMPALELSISHIAAAFSACAFTDDQVATGEPGDSAAPATTPTSTSSNEWDDTQSELVVSDLSNSVSLVESKAVGEVGIGDGPKFHDDVTDSASILTATDAVSKKESTNQSEDGSDTPTMDRSPPPDISISPDLTSSEVHQKEPHVSTSSQHERLELSLPPTSQQLDMVKQQLQHFESRDQQLVHLVGRNNRELLRQQDEQQQQLEETLVAQQQELAELRAGFRSQQHGSCVYVYKILSKLSNSDLA